MLKAKMMHFIAYRIRYKILLFVVGTSWMLANGFAADNITMNVVAANTTSEKKEKIQVRQDLPREIKKENILDAGGMDIRYDEERSLFYLYAETDLEAEASKSFSVVIQDVWQIPQSTFAFLKDQANQRLQSFEGKEKYTIAKKFHARIETHLGDILADQEAQAGDVQKRMESYRMNMRRLEDVRQKVMVIDDFSREAERLADMERENKTITFVIEAKNPSSVNRAEQVNIIRYLPEGIEPGHVVEAQGFSVKFDAEKKSYYLTNTLDFEPLETKKFEIMLSDIWNIPESKLNEYEATDNFTLKLAGTGYEKLGAFLALEIKNYIDEIRESQKNALTPEDKIATYAANIKKLEAIQKNIEQLRRLVETAEKAKAKTLSEVIKTVTPDVATTWKIIYATIAFLTIISVFFFFLWWGQTKAKQNQKIEVLKSPDKEN